MQAKKLKIIQLFKDPVKDLPVIVRDKILGYFKGKELLKLAEVSKSWKAAIDSNHVKRVLSKIKLKIVDGFPKQDFNKLKLNNRPYKHLELFDCFEEEVQLTKRYSPILQTLLINDSFNFNRIRMPACSFPCLKLLELYHTDLSWFDWLGSCTFERINEFRYTHKIDAVSHDLFNDWLDFMSDVLNLMPDLKRLFMRTQIDDIDDLGYIDYQFDLSHADFGHQFPREFLIKQADTMIMLRAGSSIDDACYALEHFENLETFAIDIEDIIDEDDEEEDEELIFDDSDSDCYIYRSYENDERELEPLPIHENIKTLFIRSESETAVHRIITSLVNLETLVFYDTLSIRDVEFLGEFENPHIFIN